MYSVEFYQTHRGEEPVKDYILEFNEKTKGKIYKYITLLQQHGTLLPRPYSDYIGNKIYELRVKFRKSQVRILYFYDGKKIILTNGFLKKTDDVPVEEKNRAISCMNNYYSRK